MKEQFAIVTCQNKENIQFLEVEGKKVFDTLEQAEAAATKSGIPNLSFFKRKVSPWEFIGDMAASDSGEF